MKDRLLSLMNAESLSPSQFADEIGIQRSAVSHLLSGRNMPSFDVLVKILKRFPEVNPEWLILGSGNMYRKPPLRSLFDQTLSEQEIAQDIPSGKGNKDSSMDSTAKTAEPSQNLPPSGDLQKKTSSVKEIILLFSDNTFSRFVPSSEE